MPRHLLDIRDLSTQELDDLMDRADDIIQNPKRYAECMHGKKLATLFYEPSTRTRLSFEAAMLELGGSVLGFSSADSSSASKGESVADTVRTVGCYADVIAMRHPKEGAPTAAAQVSPVPIINAGDGGHMHPTQTLADLATLQSRFGRVTNLTVGLCGDLTFGRTVHSLIKALSRYKDVRVILIAPDELRLPDYIKQDVCDSKGIEYKETDNLDEVLPELDVLYMTRVQKERFLDEDEFDNGARQFLNLGHTFGHAVEASSRFTLSHGKAVSIGMAMVARAACMRGLCGEDVRDAILDRLTHYGLPTVCPYSADMLLGALCADKKIFGSTLHLIVPAEIGLCRILPVPVAELPGWLHDGGAL